MSSDLKARFIDTARYDGHDERFLEYLNNYLDAVVEANNNGSDLTLPKQIEFAHEVLTDLDLSTHISSTETNRSFWRHVERPQDLVSLKWPSPDHRKPTRLLVEGATAKYLELGIRTKEMDRLLVDMLLAAEMLAYASELSIKYQLEQSAESKQKSRVQTRIWLVGLAFAAIFGAGVWHLWGILGGGLFILAVLVIIEIVYDRTAPRDSASLKSKFSQSLTLLSRMITTYSHINSAGPISASHLRHLCLKDDEAGISWPATLYTLLDDIEKRGGRF